MRFPVHIATDMVRWQVRNALARRRRYPFVLMLEPLYTCNLACLGCALERHTGKLKDRLPLEACFEAADACGAPAVSICGGEPTLYPELPALIAGIIERKRHIYLCTNALLLDTKVFGIIPPHRRLSVNVHLDGLRETHDRVCARDGVFDKAIEGIREAKARGVRVTAEACPHHFSLTDEAVIGFATNAKMNPPLRTRADVEAVIEGLADGTIDAIATDHAPHATEEKSWPIDQAPCGIIGLETALPLALALVAAGRLSLPHLIRLLTIQPAALIKSDRGSLSVGAVADVTILDPSKQWVVEPAEFRSKSRNTPFAGWKMTGRVVSTLVAGKVVYADQ